jgi:coatomer subunit epsilon
MQAMSSIDDDATLTQLALAWTGLALGGAKAQEAAYAFQELGDKYTWTVGPSSSHVHVLHALCGPC